MPRFLENCFKFFKDIWNSLFGRNSQKPDNQKDFLLSEKEDKQIYSTTDKGDQKNILLTNYIEAESELRHRKPGQFEESNLSVTLMNIHFPESNKTKNQSNRELKKIGAGQTRDSGVSLSGLSMNSENKSEELSSKTYNTWGLFQADSPTMEFIKRLDKKLLHNARLVSKKWFLLVDQRLANEQSFSQENFIEKSLISKNSQALSNTEISRQQVYTGSTEEILSKKYLGFVIEEKMQTIKKFFDSVNKEILNTTYISKIKSEMITQKCRNSILQEINILGIANKAYLKSSDLQKKIESYIFLTKELFECYLYSYCFTSMEMQKISPHKIRIDKKGYNKLKKEYIESLIEVMQKFLFILISTIVGSRINMPDNNELIKLNFIIYFFSKYFSKSSECNRKNKKIFEWLCLFSFSIASFYFCNSMEKIPENINSWILLYLPKIDEDFKKLLLHSKKMNNVNLPFEATKIFSQYFRCIKFIVRKQNLNLINNNHEIEKLYTDLYEESHIDIVTQELKTKETPSFIVLFLEICLIKINTELFLLFSHTGIDHLLRTQNPEKLKKFLADFITFLDFNFHKFLRKYNINIENTESFLFLNEITPSVAWAWALQGLKMLEVIKDAIDVIYKLPEHDKYQKISSQPLDAPRQKIPVAQEANIEESPIVKEDISDTNHLLVVKEKKELLEKECKKLNKMVSKHLRHLKKLGINPDKSNISFSEGSITHAGINYIKIQNATTHHTLYAGVSAAVKHEIRNLLGKKGEDKTEHFRMTRAVGGQGIKRLTKDEIKKISKPYENYQYKIKFLGCGDSTLRILGKLVNSEENSGSLLILFDLIVDHDLKPVKVKQKSNAAFFEEQQSQDNNQPVSQILNQTHVTRQKI